MRREIPEEGFEATISLSWPAANSSFWGSGGSSTGSGTR